jgi:hypothetical protein
MKKYIFFFLLLISFSPFAGAQVKIGDNADNMNDSSILELESTDKGLLIPRLTTEQVNAISNPANGLIIYNTTLNLLQLYITGTNPQWVNFPLTKGADNTGALQLPVGTDAQRPANPVNGMLRYNTEISDFEVYEDGDWQPLPITAVSN